MTDASTATNNTNTTAPRKVIGPDGKIYPFKPGSTNDQISSYFKRHNIGKSEQQPTAKKATPNNSDPADPSAMRSSMLGGVVKDLKNKASGTARYALDEAPNAGGLVGSL